MVRNKITPFFVCLIVFLMGCAPAPAAQTPTLVLSATATVAVATATLVPTETLAADGSTYSYDGTKIAKDASPATPTVENGVSIHLEGNQYSDQVIDLDPMDALKNPIESSNPKLNMTDKQQLRDMQALILAGCAEGEVPQCKFPEGALQLGKNASGTNDLAMESSHSKVIVSYGYQNMYTVQYRDLMMGKWKDKSLLPGSVGPFPASDGSGVFMLELLKQKDGKPGGMWYFLPNVYLPGGKYQHMWFDYISGGAIVVPTEFTSQAGLKACGIDDDPRLSGWTAEMIADRSKLRAEAEHMISSGVVPDSFADTVFLPMPVMAKN